MKRKVLLILGLLFSVVTLLGALAACGGGEEPEKKQAGSEAGTYYCDYNGVENDLTLGGECEFELKIGATVMKGGYELEGEGLTLSPENAGVISARYKNERISFTYSNVSYTFLRKIEYTVKFDTDGGTAIDDVKVVNGRTVARPTPPKKGELIFVGWYTDKTYQNPFYFSQPITGDKTICARFVEPLDPEFDVKFDLGYTDAAAMAPIRTVGHKLYPDQLPTPERTDGVAFIGWYVSDFETRDKLSRAFDLEAEVAQDFTLYAVWAETEGEPVVSVTESGVEISVDGENLGNYNLKITAPDDSESTHSDALATGATTKYDYNFAAQNEGEYKVEVEVSGKTTTRYLNNKALARVSDFRLELAGETRTLIFNSVAGATEYKITVECGTEGHAAVHTEKSLGTTTAYDFSECAMGADKTIKFTVKAYAAGHVASVSETYVYDKTLDEVDAITFDEAKGDVTWSKVPYATAYRVTVSLNDEQVGETTELLAVGTSGNVMRYSVKEIGKGEVTIEVVPVAFGWNSPEVSEYTFEKPAPAAPTNVRFEDGKIKWNAVTGATKYEVVIGETTRMAVSDPAGNTPPTEYQLQEADFGSLEEAVITVYTVGVDDADRSYASDAISVVNANEIRGLAYAGGYATWKPVFGATAYQYKVGTGNTWNTVTASKAAIEFGAAGEQTISVKAVKDGADSPVETVTVTVYTVEFDIGGAASEIDEVADMYLAAGDPISLPVPSTWPGYDFDGWYTEDGGTGAKYELTVFDGGALTLFAKWNPKKFTITLEVGAEGTCQETFEVYYRQTNICLPIPTPASVEYTFKGWYLGVGGTGRLYANATDGSAGTYTQLTDLTVYAKWTTPFAYTNKSNKLTVTAGTNIGGEKEVTIPDKHDGLPVTTVGDFNSGTTLEIINIPDTVGNITLGTVGSAFESLKNLKEVNIYHVEGNNTPKYASKNGMVYEVEGNKLVYVPKAYKAPAIGHKDDPVEVTIPDNIEVIVSGAMYKNLTITKLTIPASVREVQTNAIYGNDSEKTNANGDKLAEIVFEATENGTLTIANEAFINLHTLTSITLPKYVQALDAESHTVILGTGQIKNCVSLENINIANGVPGDAYFSEEGVLCRTAEGVREIVYYPTARTETLYTFPTTVGITVIGAHAFEKAKSLQSIVIPATITKIGESAFNGCEGIQSITFQSGESDQDLTIEREAFVGTKAQSLTVPANVTSAGWHAFYISTLQTVTLKGKTGMHVEYADKGVFHPSTENLTIEANFPVIDISSAFSSINTAAAVPSLTKAKLKTINISANDNYKQVTGNEAGKGAIFDKDMTKILYIVEETEDFTVPEGITEIGSALFYNNKTLRTITIPASVKTIADRAFSGCENLATVTFSPFVAPADSGEAKRAALTIGEKAFNECKSLATIELPAETTSIGKSAFNKCASLTEFTVPGGVAVVEEDLFSEAGIESITLSEGVSMIKAGAFNKCVALETISLPASMATIEPSVFTGCKALTTITVAEESEHFKSIDGVLYTAQKRAQSTEIDPVELLFVPLNGKADNGTLRIPATVTSVAERAAQFNTGITAIEFAEKVVKYNATTGDEEDGTLVINDYAFGGNSTGKTKFSSIKLPIGLTTIGKQAFSYLHELTSIEIPYTVTTIGTQAFYMSDRLATITFKETPQETAGVELTLAGSPFQNVTGLKNIVLPDRPKVTLSVATFSQCYNLESVTLPAGLAELPGPTSGDTGIFSNFKKLTTVNFPAQVSANFSIGKYAFSGCINLAHVGTAKQVDVDGKGMQKEVYFLPEGVKTIGAYAFRNSGLTSIGIPASMSEFSLESEGGTCYRPFGGCSKLETIAFANDCALTYLPAGLMTGARSLKYVVFGKNSHIQTIGAYASEIVSGNGQSDSLAGGVFAGASQLASITIPASVEVIENGCFMNLPSLQEVKFEEGSKLQKIGGALITSNTEEKGTDPVFAFSGLTSFTFPKITNEAGEVQELKVVAGIFSGCSSLTSIAISESVWEIDNLLKGTVALETLTVPEGSERFEVDETNKALYSLKEGQRDVLLGIYGDPGSVLNIAGGTTQIVASLYRGRTSITQVNIPDTVVSIGESAFENCINLTTVTITVGDGKTSALSLIGDAAFKNCWKLASFDFAKAVNLNRIGKEAFSACAFTKLDLRQNHQLGNNAGGTSVNGIGAQAFENAPLLGTEMIDTAIAATDQYSVMFPAELKTIEKAAFRNTPITKIDLSGTKVTKLPGGTSNDGIFMGCAQLKDVKLPVGLTLIEARTFYNSGLETINLEELVNLTDIKANAFNNTQLTSIVFPEAKKFAATTSQSSIFANNTKLKSVDMSKATRIQTYGSSAFSGCPELETVTLPSSLTTIGNNMFKDCTSLESITIPENVTSIGNSAFEGCTGLGNVTIQATGLKTIGNKAFSGTVLTSFDFPQTVESLGTNAFDGCSELAEVTFHDNSKLTIGNYAFQGTGLTSVHLPEGVASINQYAFNNCTSLTTVEYDKDGITLGTSCFANTALASFDFAHVKEVGATAFQNTKFTEFTFPEHTISWKAGVFTDCAELTQATFPSYVTEIPASMLKGCTALEKVTIQNEYLTTINNSAFEGCTALDEIEWPASLDSLTKLGTSVFKGTGFTAMDLSKMTNEKINNLPTSTFSGCESLGSVRLAQNMVTFGGKEVFKGCTSLTTVNGMNQITTLTESAFDGCTSLATIDISNVTTFAKNAFKGCTELNNVTINENATAIAEGTFAGCASLANIGDTETANITSIAKRAFQGTAFTTFKIPASLTTVTASAFDSCTDLVSFTVADENETFVVGENGELYQRGEGDAKILICYPAAATTVEIAADATEIAALAFSGIGGTGKTLTVPGNVTIDGYAFVGCTFDKVIVEDGEGALAQYAFAQNSSTYPDAICGVKEVEFRGSTALNASAAMTSSQYLFQNNTGTTKVTFPEGLTTIGSYWFAGTSKTSSADAIPTAITTVVIPASVTTIKDSAFKDASLTDIVIPETVTTIEQNAFANNTSLTHLTFNAPVDQVNIAASVFSGCTSLETVKFGSKVTTIGEKMFEGCTSLAHFVAVADGDAETQDALPESVDYIGAAAFKGTAIEKLTLPGSAEKPLTIVHNGNDGTFEGCAKLKNMVVPEGTTELPYKMFYGCTALEWVKLPDTIIKVNGNVFYNCASLKFVNLPGSIAEFSSSFLGKTPNLHVFVAKGIAKFGTGIFWTNEEGNRHIYFEDDEYTVLSTRGLTWHAKTDHSDFTCGATLAQALEASGATDFPEYNEIVTD